MTDTEWWLARERDPHREDGDRRGFPTVTRVSADGGFDVAPDAEDYNLAFAVDDFAFGLRARARRHRARVIASRGAQSGVATRVGLAPGPGRADHLVEARSVGPPAEDPPARVRRRDEDRRVAGPSRADVVRDRLTDHALGGGDAPRGC